MIANQQMKGMKFCVENPSDAKCHSNLEDAFGPNYDLAKIKDNLNKIDGPIPVQRGYKFLPKGTAAETVFKPNAEPSARVEIGVLDFPSQDARERAGTLLHEKAHVSVEATDAYKEPTGDEPQPGRYLTMAEQQKIEKGLKTAQQSLGFAEKVYGSTAPETEIHKKKVEKAQAEVDSVKKVQCMKFSIFR
jgi:hypothetical protein